MKTRIVKGQIVTVHRNDGLRKRCECPRSGWVRCKHPWHANHSHGGKEYRVSLGKWARKPADYVMLQGEAKKLYRQWIGEIENGPKVSAPVVDAPTFTTIADLYLTDYVHHPDRRTGAAKEMARQIEVLRKVFGPLPMTEISKPLIETFRLDRRQAHEAGKAAIDQLAALELAKATDDTIEIPAALVKDAQRARVRTKSGRVATNRLLARLRHLFAWAITEKELLEASPFTKAGRSVIKLDGKAETGRGRRLQGDEEARLLAAAGPHLRACLEAALETGMRRGEILGLQWQHVHSTAGIIDLPASVTKTGVGRSVIITSRLAVILAMRADTQRVALDLKEDDDLPVDLYPFGNEIGERVQGFKSAWRLTCKRAGIEGLHFHDLRRESGSRLIETAGVSLTDVRDFWAIGTSARRMRIWLPQRCGSAMPWRNVTRLAQTSHTRSKRRTARNPCRW